MNIRSRFLNHLQVEESTDYRRYSGDGLVTRMNHVRLSGLCGIGVLLLHAFPADATVSARGQSSVDVEMGTDTTRIHKINRTFDVVGVPSPDGAGRTLVLDVTVETEESPPIEGYSLNNVKLRAFEVTNVTKKELFRIQGKGEAAHKIDGLPLFVVSDWGCCSANTTHAIYSLVTGNRLFFAGGGRDPDMLELSTGTEHYLVGVHASGSARDAEIYQRPVKRMERSLLVTYASLSAPLDAVRVTLGAGANSEVRIASMRWSRASGVSEDGLHMTASEKRLTGQPAAVEIVIASFGTITIPIRNGRLDESTAKFPGGVHIEHLPVAKQASH
jgi:hypothetical protein